MDPRTDQVAREAARLIQTGRTSDIHRAIAMAVDALGYKAIDRPPLPGVGRVRQHAHAMSMQAMGEAGYLELRRRVWRIAEEMLSALELAILDGRALLAGRAAEGHIDAGVAIHIRLYTHRPVGEIAAALVEFGYEEPEFQTADTCHGRLNQLKFIEDGFEVIVTRCMPELESSADKDLFTGKSIATIDVRNLRRKIEEHLRSN